MNELKEIIQIILTGKIHDCEPPKDDEFCYEGAVGFDQLSDYLYHKGYKDSDNIAQSLVDCLIILGFTKISDYDLNDDYFIR